jgi:cytidine deaminase
MRLVMTDEDLVAEARRHLGEFKLADPADNAGDVAAALVTEAGNVYSGICFDVSCGIGFCAEHLAVAEMLKSRETVIRKIVAVSAEGILAPCGRCRELLALVDTRNFECEIIVSSGKRTLRELLPEHWRSNVG